MPDPSHSHPAHHREPSIMLLELIAVAVGLKTWAPHMSGLQIAIRSDNQGVVQCINKRSSKCPFSMCLIHRITLLSLNFQILVVAKYLPRILNLQSDQLSRGKPSTFRMSNIGQQYEEDHPSPNIWPISWQKLSDWKILVPRSPQLFKYKYYHDKYKCYLETICKEKEPIKTNINNYIAYLSLCSYSGAYINNLVKALVYYPEIKPSLCHHLHNAEVHQALCKVKKQDTGLPVNEKLMDQLCRIFDRDLGPYKAILIKAALWLALNCMLCISAYAEALRSTSWHVLPFKDVIPDEGGILVNFCSHKWCKQETTLYFPYLGS